MAMLEKVNQMKRQGMSDSEIIEVLQSEGVSPREINDAISQSRIKEAISNGNRQDTSPVPNFPGSEDMSASIMDQYSPQREYQEGQYQQEQYPEQGYSQNQIPPQTTEPQYPQEQYNEQPISGDYGAGYQEYGSSTDVVSEITNQIIDEKMSKMNKTVANLKEIKILLDAKVEKIDARLTRIESVIDSLQNSLLRRTGEQAQNIEDIKTEMQGIQEGFGKVINPLISRANSGKSSKSGKKKK
ncbi:MAG: hypothetical protein WC533_04250 [Candidatus Pacearchaeota archaeon]